jgi:hypothetical protein
MSAAVGGTVSEIGGGKFANGAFTSAFQYIAYHVPTREQLSISNIGKGMAVSAIETLKMSVDLAGKAWNSPNTALRLGFGILGFITESVCFPFTGNWDFGISLENNAIQFTGHNLAGTAITLGNVINYTTSYGPNIYNHYEGHTIADHERMHTFQGQILGPAYLPAVILSYGISLLASGNTHGPYSFMERGPQTIGRNKVFNFSSKYKDPYWK